MEISTSIEKYVGRKINFKKEVKLKKSSQGDITIDEWNIEGMDEPSIPELESIYQDNAIPMDIDAKVRLNPDFKLVRVENSLYAVLGYPEIIDLTAIEYESWREYLTGMNIAPVRIKMDENDLPELAQDGAVSYKTRYINVSSEVTLDASASVWVFNNDNDSVIVRLPNAQNCEGRMYYLKNLSNRKPLYVYPQLGQTIDSSSYLSIGRSRNCTILSIKDESGHYGWVILENP